MAKTRLDKFYRRVAVVVKTKRVLQFTSLTKSVPLMSKFRQSRASHILIKSALYKVSSGKITHIGCINPFGQIIYLPVGTKIRIL